MKIVKSEDHRTHAPTGELYGGELVVPFERPERWDIIVARLNEVGLTDFMEPDPLDMGGVGRIHEAAFLHFLETAWDQWRAEQYNGEALPTVIPARRMQQREPDHIDGKLGYFCMAIETAITEGTWNAARASAAIAQTGQRLVSAGDRTAFSLCRPPGHHAASDLYGGYCFLNNAAIAAQGFLDAGASRVAILDVDFHHGNGTQDIFFRRSDVMFLSLHGDPRAAFPHFLGYADETGEGEGEGFNINYPMRDGADFHTWHNALEDACVRIGEYAPDAVVVSLGVDTFKEDPISFFRLESADFLTYGARIEKIGLPTLFVMEGGYAIDAIGINTANVLQGFLGA
ncbi:MAG: histone deacetylase family protein [Hyphomicrobiales bacterium]